MKKIMKFLGLALLAVSYFSCDDGNKINENMYNPSESNFGGILRTLKVNGVAVQTSVNFANLTYNLDASTFTLSLEANDHGNGKFLQKIESYVSFRKNTGVPVANQTETTPVLFKTFEPSSLTTSAIGLPQLDFSTTLSEIRTKLNISPTQYSGGDQFFVLFKYYMTDGRVYSNNNSSATVIGGSYNRSPFKYTLNIVCPISESLAGSHTYVLSNVIKGSGATGAPFAGTSTGTVVWGDTTTPGLYTTSDLGFGQFALAWGDTPAVSPSARVRWFCSNIEAVGLDQYSDSYSYTKISCVGPVMTIDFKNTYNDAGRVVITRQGGVNWPAIFQ
jgi:hypothetical protein